MGESAQRRRAWPVRMTAWLVRPFTGALVTGVADPPSPRPAWRTPEALQHMARYLPTRSIDVVVLVEVFVAIAIFAGTNSVLVSANQQAGYPVANGELLILAGAAAAVPLLLREVWPLAAWRLAVPAMIFVVWISRDVYPAGANPYPFGAVLTYLLVLYSVGLRCPRHVSVGAWLISVLGTIVLHPDPSWLLVAVLTAAALLYGYNVRVRRAAQRQVVAEEQRTADERAARAVLEERSRIARELHDVVAHHMSVIAIQAEAAPIKAPSDPEVLKAELASIRATSLAALAELRRVLGVLRNGDRAPETAPQPDLSDIAELLASFRAAGLMVTVTTTGRPPGLAAGVGLAAYRILQESLSNALRHAPGAAVRVEIDHRGHALRLRVVNDPPPQPPPQPPAPARTGQGLAGMRERVGAWSGTLTTGPTPDGGFEVAATLPTEAPGQPADTAPTDPTSPEAP